MDPKLLTLATLVIAAGIAAGSAFVPDSLVAEFLRGIAMYLAGGVTMKRPGDLSPSHIDDVRGDR